MKNINKKVRRGIAKEVHAVNVEWIRQNKEYKNIGGDIILYKYKKDDWDDYWDDAAFYNKAADAIRFFIDRIKNILSPIKESSCYLTQWK